MALSTETQAWLDDLKKEGGLSDEAYKTLAATLESSAKADLYVKGSALRQADYSRQMNDVKTAKESLDKATAELQKKEADVTKYQTDLAQWKSGADVSYNKALKEREVAFQKATAAIARLKTVADSAGLDSNELLKDLETEQVNPPQQKSTLPEGFDPTQYVRREDIATATREGALIDATIHDLSGEYQDLFGTRLPGAATLVQEAMTARKSLREYVETKFDFAKKRAEQSEAMIQDRIKKAVDESRTQLLSEANLQGGPRPTGRDDLRGSPVFREGGLAVPKDSMGGGGVSAAVAAFNTKKYAK